MDHLKVMQELVSIRRGNHPGWEGDPVANADTFCRCIGYDMPDNALALVSNLLNNVGEYSDLLGIPPSRVRYYADEIADGIKSRHITDYCSNKGAPGQPPPIPR